MPSKSEMDNLEHADTLRIHLDSIASGSYREMEEILKSQGKYVKFQPSRFISFLIQQYRNNHFEQDKEILMKEFFDSKEYLASALKNAKSTEEIQEVLDEAIKRLKIDRRGRRTVKQSDI
jgi:hypothetical protein